ncbi:type II toxin-antitoxin system YafQ family toxin [Patescibacteria group bacterium]|nr:type II toxin-antitoxin system YafQ family toxin [Patescibacteria group bacterium]MBU1123503.1 type II toxin-antitoxin system YafQ family toxin [Patescibacteria group bacterium]MBU1911286.1 type II toxin-antitoxin system YafQ family toxin [Patescibacteria group bacterium]
MVSTRLLIKSQTIKLLQCNKNPPSHLHNHKLHGDMSGLEECHVENDWLIVYEQCNKELVLTFVRTGSHSDVFGK